MEYKKQLIDRVENFYIGAVEEFKELELFLMADSKFKNMFKKKDYDGNIGKIKACKRQILKISTSDIDIPKDDEESERIVIAFENCILGLNNLCDSYIQLQEALKRKSEGSNLKYSEYKNIFNKVQDNRGKLNSALHELDIIYTDYTIDEDPYTFL